MAYNLKTRFPVFTQYPQLCFLDSASTNQRPDLVIDALGRFHVESNANVHRGGYSLSNNATSRYENTRKLLAAYIGTAAENLSLVSGTTMGINLVARSVIAPVLKKNSNIVTTIAEHHSNLLPWQQITREKGAELRIAGLGKDNCVDLNDLASKIDGNTALITVTHISNVLGGENDISAISEIAHAQNVPLLVDMAQGAALHTLDVSGLDLDFVTFSGHKMYGPFGTGGLFVSSKWHEKMETHFTGGGMVEEVNDYDFTPMSFPGLLEAGTPNVSGYAGLGAAVEFLNGIDKDEAAKQVREIAEYAREKLSEIKSVKIYSARELKGALFSFTIEGVHPHDAATFLNSMDISVRAGYHCAQPIHNKLGSGPTLRASFGIYNTMEDAKRLAEGVKETIKIWN